MSEPRMTPAEAADRVDQSPDYDPGGYVRILIDHARATSPAPKNVDLAADDHRRFSACQVRGALGWWLYAAETGDQEGGTKEAARNAIGHEDADRLARLLPLTTPETDEPTDADVVAALREGLNLPADAERDTVLMWLDRWLHDPLNQPADEGGAS